MTGVDLLHAIFYGALPGAAVMLGGRIAGALLKRRRERLRTLERAARSRRELAGLARTWKVTRRPGETEADFESRVYRRIWAEGNPRC